MPLLAVERIQTAPRSSSSYSSRINSRRQLLLATRAKTTTTMRTKGQKQVVFFAAASSNGKKNFIKIEKPAYTEDNPRPWYIEESTGKANGLVVLVVFMASQVFIGTVIVPIQVFLNQLWSPIVGGHLWLENIY